MKSQGTVAAFAATSGIHSRRISRHYLLWAVPRALNISIDGWPRRRERESRSPAATIAAISTGMAVIPRCLNRALSDSTGLGRSYRISGSAPLDSVRASSMNPVVTTATFQKQ